MQNENADWIFFSQEWHAEDCAKVAQSRDFTQNIFLIRMNVCYLNGLSLQQNAADHAAASWCER
jgi:hypothetical protein